MKLYSAKLSLFGRKVEIALAEKGLSFERVQVPFSQTKGYAPKHPDVLAVNPKGQVPVLVDDDLQIYDSTLIFEYLEDAYPEPALYPREARAKARCRQWELYADEMILPPLRSLMHRTEPHGPDDQRWNGLEAKTAEALPLLASRFAALDAGLAGRAFLCESFSVADIACFLMVLYSERLVGPDLQAFKNIIRWCENLKIRPAFSKVISEIIEADSELSAPVAGAFAGGIFRSP